jgi:uncharacterized protein with HEPN domain
MPDLALIREVLRQMLWSTQTIAKRFAAIRSPADFTSSDDGMEKLDAICMQLIAVGESVKHLDKITDGALLPQYPGIEWKRIMGMRDILSHQYFDIDAEVVYSVCALHLDALGQTIERMLADLDA